MIMTQEEKAAEIVRIHDVLKETTQNYLELSILGKAMQIFQ